MHGRDLVEAIKTYGQRAKAKELSCELDACPRCGVRHVEFRWRGVRERLFLVLADWVVQRVWSYLPLWKCPLC